MLLRKESLEKIDVCRDFLAYVTAGPRTCLNHLYRSFSKSVCDAGKFQPFLILATLTPPSLLAALTPHSLLTALQERKRNSRHFFYCRTATVPWFCTSIVLVIDRSSHFLCLLPRETPCSSGANNHTVPYPPKAVLWAIGTVSAENVFDVEMNKVVKFIVFHRLNNHLFRCTNRTELYETALTRRFKTHHFPPYELVQADFKIYFPPNMV